MGVALKADKLAHRVIPWGLVLFWFGSGRRVANAVCLALLDGNGGVRVAWVWRLHMDQVDLMDLMDKMGAPVFALTGYAAASHVIPRGFACAAVWVGSGQIYRRGVQGFFMATAVCSLRGRDACIRLIRLIRLMREVWGRHVIPRGFACRCVGCLRVQIYRWVMPRIRRPK